MQDLQNTSDPNVNPPLTEDEYGNPTDIEGENISGEDTTDIPLPPTEPKPPSIEEPPDAVDKPKIDEPRRKPTQIV